MSLISAPGEKNMITCPQFGLVTLASTPNCKSCGGLLVLSLSSRPPTPPVPADIVGATTQLYRAVGYAPPWIGYLAVENDTCVGTVASSPSHITTVFVGTRLSFPFHYRDCCTRSVIGCSELLALVITRLKSFDPPSGDLRLI